MKTKLIIFTIVTIIVVGLAMFFNETSATEYQAETTVTASVDPRDNIQKLTDNFAQAFRDLQEAEKEHEATALKLEAAMSEYNEAAEYLATYTNAK